jgi:hypothetical protein
LLLISLIAPRSYRNTLLSALLGLRQGDPEHTVLELGLRRAGVNWRGQPQHALEGAKALLADEEVPARVAFLAGVPPLGPNADDVARHRDLDILRGRSGDGRLDDEGIAAICNVDREPERATPPSSRGRTKLCSSRLSMTWRSPMASATGSQRVMLIMVFSCSRAQTTRSDLDERRTGGIVRARVFES